MICLVFPLELLAAPIPGKGDYNFDDVENQALRAALKVAGINSEFCFFLFFFSCLFLTLERLT
jgi:hypothetical protein